MNKYEAARSIFLIGRIERTAVCKKAAEKKSKMRKWCRFHNLQLQAKYELREILKFEEQQARDFQEREKVMKMLSHMKRRGLLKAVRVVAKAHMIPLEQVKR